MTGAVPAPLRRTLASARRRAVILVMVAGAPWWLAAAALAWRVAGGTIAGLVAATGVAMLIMLARRRAAAFDSDWLVRRLDARRADLEDSSDLFFADGGGLLPLQRLQLARLQRRLRDGTIPELREPWPRVVLAASLLGALAAVTTIAWPAHTPPALAPGVVAPADSVPSPARTRIVATSLSITPPSYTGLRERSSPRLDAKVVEGSRLRWRVTFAPAPSAAALVFLDGRRIPLMRGAAEEWAAESRIASGTLYRIVADDRDQAPRRAPYRIDVETDRPPDLRVTTPASTLVERKPGQRTWDLVAEASDDFGVVGAATLRITLAQGSGENISFHEQVRTVAGSGPARARRFAARLDLDALGLAEGDDVVVQFLVRDNRAPAAQEARSASHILRWSAAPPAQATGIDGLVRTTLPAYFRSQRQIVIDAEALIARRKALAPDAFTVKSDAIGVDQRLLRLRYGQFLGEESEGAPRRPLMPTNDAEDVAAARAEEAAAEDEHGHADETPAAPEVAGFGRSGDLLAEFGHTHDHSEAATLLDPETRTTLRAALNEMWQSELNLRQGKPDAALPFANRALEYIKQVQQASRIYLGRVGNQLPPVDPGRRLGGKREGIAPRAPPRPTAPDADSPAAAAWQALDAEGADLAVLGPALGELERWLRDARVQDPLAVLAGIDAVRRDPACAACRQRLRGLLWTLIEPPAPAPANRAVPDGMGAAYLDALRRSGP